MNTAPTFDNSFDMQLGTLTAQLNATLNALKEKTAWYAGANLETQTDAQLAAAIVDAESLKNGVIVTMNNIAAVVEEKRQYVDDVYSPALEAWNSDIDAAIDIFSENMQSLATPQFDFRCYLNRGTGLSNKQKAMAIAATGETVYSRYCHATVGIHTDIFSSVVDLTAKYNSKPQGNNHFYVFFGGSHASADYENVKYSEFFGMLKNECLVFCNAIGVESAVAEQIFAPFYTNYLIECFGSMPYTQTNGQLGKKYGSPGVYDGFVALAPPMFSLTGAPVQCMKYFSEYAIPALRNAAKMQGTFAAFSLDNSTDESTLLMLEGLRATDKSEFTRVMLDNYGIDMTRADMQQYLNAPSILDAETTPVVSRWEIGAPVRLAPLVSGYDLSDLADDLEAAVKRIGDVLDDVFRELSRIFLPDFVESAFEDMIKQLKKIAPAVFPAQYIITGDFDKVRNAMRKYVYRPFEKTFVPQDLYEALRNFEQKYRTQIKIVAAIIVVIFVAWALAPQFMAALGDAIMQGLSTVGQWVIDGAQWTVDGVESAYHFVVDAATDYVAEIPAAIKDKLGEVVAGGITDAAQNAVDNGKDTPKVVNPPTQGGAGILAALAAGAMLLGNS